MKDIHGILTHVYAWMQFTPNLSIFSPICQLIWFYGSKVKVNLMFLDIIYLFGMKKKSKMSKKLK